MEIECIEYYDVILQGLIYSWKDVQKKYPSIINYDFSQNSVHKYLRKQYANESGKMINMRTLAVLILLYYSV